MATAISNYDSTRTSTYLTRTSVIDLSRTSNTMCCWVLCDSDALPYQGIMSQKNWGAPFLGTLGDEYGIWTASMAGFVNSTTKIDTSNWKFIASTFLINGGSSVAKIYIGTTPADLSEENSAIGSPDQGNPTRTDINFCRYWDNDPPGYDGKIVCTRIFDVILTVDQMKELMVNPEMTFGNEVVYWMKMNSSLSEDFSGNSNTATVTGTFGTQVNGPSMSIPTMMIQ